MTVKPIPDGYHAITPYLCIKGVSQFLEFMKKAFDAEVMFYHSRPDGVVMHAQLKVGDSIIMAGEPHGDSHPMPSMFYMYVNDVDSAYKKAIQAGAKSVSEPADQFYGDRTGGVQDNFGNQWWVATHKEDLTNEELKQRAEKIKR